MNSVIVKYQMYIVRFCSTCRDKTKEFHNHFLPTKIVITVNDRNHSASRLGMAVFLFELRLTSTQKKVKVKSSRYRSGVAQRVPGGLGPQIFMTFGT